MSNAQGGLGEVLRSYWFPLAAALALAATWGGDAAIVNTVVRGNETMLTKLDKLSTDVASVRTAGQFTSQDIADLRSRVQILEQRR